VAEEERLEWKNYVDTDIDPYSESQETDLSRFFLHIFVFTTVTFLGTSYGGDEGISRGAEPRK
jgi:hypothetical protein